MGKRSRRRRLLKKFIESVSWEFQWQSPKFSSYELKDLLHKCYDFIDRNPPQMHPIQVVYRCKPKAYWDKIRDCKDNVMEPYIKDNSGQPRNLINGRINGLFFSAFVSYDNSLPSCSAFGDVRMTISARSLLCRHRHNLYFADFYCNTSLHYVTIVVCVIGSSTDQYCSSKLIKLNARWNPFLKQVPLKYGNEKYRFYINEEVRVEIFYTEDIDLDDAEFERIMATGRGSSRVGGVPNNKRCTICNLDPVY